MKKINYLFLLLIVLLVFSCKKDNETYSDGLVLAENTIILDDEQINKMTFVSPNEIVFIKEAPITGDAFKIGDIIVTGISDGTPRGFLRRVTSVTETETEIILGTVHASLTDAIERCDFKIERVISPDDFRDYTIDVEFDLGDNVPVTGNVEITPKILFDLTIEDFNVEYAKMGFGADYDMGVSVEILSTVNYAIEEELLEKDLKPIVILIGGIFPIIITSDIELLAGLEFAGPSLNVNYKVEGGSIDYYVQKDAGGWSPHKDVVNGTPTLNGLSGSIEAGFEVYLKPALEIEFYDRDEVETFLYVKKSVIGEASFDTSTGFECEVYCGLSLGAEVNVEILGFTANPSIEAEVVKFPPFYECPESGLTEDIDEFIPDSLLNNITDELDIPINGGLNPPNIEGTYLVSPNIMISTNITDDSYDIGHTFGDLTFTLFEQSQEDLTVLIDYSQGSSISDAVGSYITGSGNKFSVFTELEVEDNEIGNHRIARVFSGEISSTGIIDFSCALLMLDDYGDAMDRLIEIGQGRGFADSDGFSPRQ